MRRARYLHTDASGRAFFLDEDVKFANPHATPRPNVIDLSHLRPEHRANIERAFDILIDEANRLRGGR